ncbi:unnamed protein product [Adineta ricciae]|uniref:FAM193 C-terminal domain-containing protein n=1 Tax=Adineta ricciae TaxID=249248 RepID=A0A815UVQ5_ADIRI|nr:unnamed protein product [Adineta ricciae]
METQEQRKSQTVSVGDPYLLRLKCFLCHAPNPNVNDENNNLKKDNDTNEKIFNPILKLPFYTCPNCDAKIRSEEKETTSRSAVISQELEGESDQMIIVPDTSSDDEYWCHSCTDDEHDVNYRQMWDDLSYIVKCVYRATDKDFSENHFSDDICKAKEYIKTLTDVNSQSLFNKLESIVFDYVREIRNQVLERFHSCSKTSHDVQLFISFLLDEYQLFIQAATNVSSIVSYLEEHYMKSLHLTWLLYNKHLYEKLIYMDRKIQHSMSTMIDLLQPSNDDDGDEDSNEYSPAEYTQLLNRFLAFDEEMSEIACLYKDSQVKTKSLSTESSKPTEKQKKTKRKKKCKKNKQLQASNEEPANNSSTTAVDIPTSNGALSTPTAPEQGSNGSSIGSGIGGDESSSVSSADDYFLDHDSSSPGYTQEEREFLDSLFTEEDLNELLLEGILDGVSPMGTMHHELLQTRYNEKSNNLLSSSSATTTTTIDNGKWFEEIIQKIQLAREQEQKTTNNVAKTKTSSAMPAKEVLNVPSSPDVPSKKSSSTKSKSSKSSHRRKEQLSTQSNSTTSTSQLPKKSIPADLVLPNSIADLSAKIQSVSFTAGTFGSITSTDSNDCYNLTSSSSSSSGCSTTTLTAAKTTTSTGQTRLSINLTRKPGVKSTEHGGQKIAEALFNELTGLGNGECLNSGRKKDNQQFKKTKQQRLTTNEPSLSTANSSHSFLNSSSKPDSSSAAYNDLDRLLRNAASNSEVSEAALHSILSSLHSQTCVDSSSSPTTASAAAKHLLPSKTSEALQNFLAQQQQQHHHHHYHHQQKRNLPTNDNNKHCDFCCCEYSEGRTCSSTSSSSSSSSSACLHLSSTANLSNGPVASCVTCMALPGGTTTTTSVMGATITGAFNQRNVEMKERLQLKIKKRTVKNQNEQQETLAKEEQQKKAPTANDKKQPVSDNTKAKPCPVNKNDIDDLVRFIDGLETFSPNNNVSQTQTVTTSSPAAQESTSKKNKKKKDKQAKVNHAEEVKASNKEQQQQQQQQTNQKKQNGPNSIQQSVSSQQPSRSASSSSSSKAPSIASSTSGVENQQPLSKRKQKAKLRLEQQQQQKQTEAAKGAELPAPPSSSNSVNTTASKSTSTAPPVSSASISLTQETKSARSDVDLASDDFDAPEEEVNWITISRKQSKHKPPSASVPSLLAAPIPPVVPPTNVKQSRPPQQQTTTHTKKTVSTTNGLSAAQQKVVSPTVATSTIPLETPISSNKPQPTAIVPSRSQNVSKVQSSPSVQPPSNLWTSTHVQDHPLVTPPPATSSTLPLSSSAIAMLQTTPSYLPTQPSVPSPSSSLTAPITSNGTSTIPPSSLYWDPNDYLLPQPSQSSIIPPPAPGPVQRPSPSFSPAPGSINNTSSRCIQRPSPEPWSYSTNNVPFPLYSPMNYAASGSTSAWNDTSVTNTHDSQWNYPQEQSLPLQSSTASNDFPLYDPFHSGASLTIPSSTTPTNLLSNGFAEHFIGLGMISHDNDANEMDAFNKEIEDFKKLCFESVPLETREKVPVNVDRCFVRQA